MHNPQTSHVYPVRNRKPVSLRTPHSYLTSTTPDTFALGARCRGLRLNRCPTDTRPPNQPGSTNARPEDADLLVARDTAAHSAQASREKPPPPPKKSIRRTLIYHRPIISPTESTKMVQRSCLLVTSKRRDCPNFAQKSSAT